MVAQDFNKFKNCLIDKRFVESSSKGRFKILNHDYNALGIYDSDINSIVNCQSFRRLDDKTQVFNTQANRHIRTRLKHTWEVWNNSRIISSILGLNTSLCEAIALGHDVGHAPFGHLSEDILNRVLPGLHVNHALLSVVILQLIENKGMGLNLSYETLEGILNHSRRDSPLNFNDNSCQEYSVAMVADKISYLFSDFNDARRMNKLSQDNPLHELIFSNAHALGSNHHERVLNCIYSLCQESNDKGYVSFSEGRAFELFDELKNSMYSKVYKTLDMESQRNIVLKVHETLRSAELNDCVKACLRAGYEVNNPSSVPDSYILFSLLTDTEVFKLRDLLELNYHLSVEDVINNTVLREILPHMLDKDYKFNELFTKNLDYSVSKNPEYFNEVLAPYFKSL